MVREGSGGTNSTPSDSALRTLGGSGHAGGLFTSVVPF